MYKIEEDTQTIKVNRGNDLPLYFTIPLEFDEDSKPIAYYEFQTGDVINFGVYKKKHFNEAPLIYKKVIVDVPTTEIDLSLTEEETKIGDIINKPKDYWYEVEYKGTKLETVLGYDDDGAKIFRLYPEGSDLMIDDDEIGDVTDGEW